VQLPSSPPHSPHLHNKIELDEVCENESLVSLHEFKSNGINRAQRSGSQTTWNYKRQFSITREKIPYIDEVSQSLIASFTSKEKSIKNKHSVRTNKSNRLSKQSVEIVSEVFYINSR